MIVTLTACSAAQAPTPAGSTPSSDPPSTTVVTITSSDVPDPAPAEPVLRPDAPRRIVSLATGVAETLAALGVAEHVVARDESSTATSLDDVPVVTKAHSVSAERVLALTPDLVLIDASTSPPEAIDQIRATGVRVVEVPEAWTLADIAPRTLAVAQAVGVPDVTANEISTEATSLASMHATPAHRPSVAFLYLRGTSAIYLMGGRGSGADALIDAAGGIDVGAERGLGAFEPLTAEALAAANPDVILVMTKGLESVGGVDGLVQLPGVAQTRAGRERRVIAVDDTLLLSFGPRTGALISALSTALDQVTG